MKIALCHFRVGETDGVSLEMDKWKKALEQLGHDVIYIAGSAGKCQAELIPELHYQNPLNNAIVEQAYHKIQNLWPEDELRLAIFNLAEEIETALLKIIREKQIDIIVPNNILSLGWGLSAGIAFANAIKNPNVKAVCHHHDFFWERELYSNPNTNFIGDILLQYFPPSHPNIQHVCINQLAKDELYKRHKIDANVVPNVFDFDKAVITKDDFNCKMRTEFGINKNDIVILQATRIVERKAIELAIDFVSELQKSKSRLFDQKLYNGEIFNKDSRIHLVLAGQSESEKYYQSLLRYAKEKLVNIIDISQWVAHQRSESSQNLNYSLWDAYSMADLVSYPSILEGWGNQLLEAVVARLPIVCYEYPVFISDIEKYQFSTVSLGNEHYKENGLVKIDQQILQNAASQSIKYLMDPDFRKLETDKNYQIAKQELSVTKLQSLLKPLFADA